MNNNLKYVFAGNRASVLKKMMELELDIVKVWAVPGSYLQRFLEDNQMEYSLIENKAQLVNEIENEEFDILVSNGLPIILPINEMDKKKRYINVHPSLLPELRGRDPIPGALLFNKKIGVTCHFMDEGIDTGDVIAQIEIDSSDDLEAGLLYQLSFIAEAEAFEKAFLSDFEKKTTSNSGKGSYYSFNENDLKMDISKDSIESMIFKVNAFATKNKLAYFEVDGMRFRCMSACIINNKYFLSHINDYKNYGVALKYENKVIIRVDDKLIKFEVVC